MPGDDRRLFLALWPDPDLRRALAAVARQAAGAGTVPDANLHMTLVFLGATDPRRLACYQSALAGLTVPDLTLTLDRLGCWRRKGILWLAPDHTPPALTDLVEDLEQRLSLCGFAPDTRPYRAHVTLARRHTRPAPSVSFPPIVWRTNQVALVESLPAPDGVRYRVAQTWPA